MSNLNTYINSGNIFMFPISNLRKYPGTLTPQKPAGATSVSLPDGRSISEFNLTSALNTLTDYSQIDNDGFIADYKVRTREPLVLRDLTLVICGYVVEIKDANISVPSSGNLFGSILIRQGGTSICVGTDDCFNAVDQAVRVADKAMEDAQGNDYPGFEGLILTAEKPEYDVGTNEWTKIDDPGIDLSTLAESAIKTVQIFKDNRVCESAQYRIASKSVKNIYGGTC